MYKMKITAATFGKLEALGKSTRGLLAMNSLSIYIFLFTSSMSTDGIA